MMWEIIRLRKKVIEGVYIATEKEKSLLLSRTYQIKKY